MRLTETTETAANHVDIPADSGVGSPQDTVWTNNIRLEKFTSHVDGSYKKVLPNRPDEFYVKLDETRIGVVNGGITVEWKRGNHNELISNDDAGFKNSFKQCLSDPKIYKDLSTNLGELWENNISIA